jgi:FkbM family methyltransferase
MLGIGLLTGAYHVARSSGLLDTRAGRRLFLAAYFAYKRRIEDPYASLIARRPELFRGGHILDVGANVGYCSVLFAGAADAGRKVYAFEPEPFNFDLLQEALRRHGVEEVVKAQRAAVGRTDGTLRMRLNPRHHGDHRMTTAADAGTIEVPAVRIDSVVERERISPVRFIKIDVQGYEPAVCQGMERTLTANPDCVVSLEYMPEALREQGFEPREFLDWFEARGYRAYPVRDGKVPQDLGESMPAGGWIDVLFQRA